MVRLRVVRVRVVMVRIRVRHAWVCHVALGWGGIGYLCIIIMKNILSIEWGIYAWEMSSVAWEWPRLRDTLRAWRLQSCRLVCTSLTLPQLLSLELGLCGWGRGLLAQVCVWATYPHTTVHMIPYEKYCTNFRKISKNFQQHKRPMHLRTDRLWCVILFK